MAAQKSNRLLIPKHWGEGIYYFVITCIILGFCSIGIYNLINGVGIISSCLWLGLVLMILYAACSEYGLWGFIKNILGAFATRHFLECSEGQVKKGFKFFGVTFFYIILLVEKIESVSWSVGQASHYSGRDLADWSVAVWYDHDDSQKSEERKKKIFKKTDQDLFIIGPSGKKEMIVAFADSLVLFLNKAGAELIPDKDEECKFVRKLKS